MHFNQAKTYSNLYERFTFSTGMVRLLRKWYSLQRLFFLPELSPSYGFWHFSFFLTDSIMYLYWKWCLVALINLSVIGFSFVVFHDKAKRAQQVNLPSGVWPWFTLCPTPQTLLHYEISIQRCGWSKSCPPHTWNLSKILHDHIFGQTFLHTTNAYLHSQ